MSNKKISVAIQQHFLSHYRRSIFSLMSSQTNPKPEYTFFSGEKSPEKIATISSDQLVSEISKSGQIRWRFVKNFWMGRTFLFQSKIISLAASKKYDCIIYLGSMYHISTWISAIVAKIYNKRVLMWTHGYLRNEPGIKGYTREIFYRLADGLLLYGNRGRDFLEKRGFDPKNLYVVYNSLDYPLQKTIRAQWNLEQLKSLREKYFKNPDHPILVFTGRLTKRKQLDFIFQAQSKLKDMNCIVNVLIIGDGPELQNLKNLCANSNLSDYANFTGACYNENIIGPLLMMSDICISPGEIGLTCIHSMAYGTPVITHNDANTQGPEWESIIPGVTGNFFTKGDCNSLTQSIASWLNSRINRDLVSANCIAIVEKNYSPENQLKVINRAVEGLPALDNKYKI